MVNAKNYKGDKRKMNKTRNVEIWLSTEWGIFGYLKRGKCKEWEIKEND